MTGVPPPKRRKPARRKVTFRLYGTPFITAAAHSDLVNEEWKKRGFSVPDPVYKDYALMKVLYMLRHNDNSLRVSIAKYDKPITPLDFSTLKDTDIIFIVAHGDPWGLYAMGPDSSKNVDRLVEVLTKDGNLRKKRKGKEIEIGLLSCRAGLGLHEVLAHKLYQKLKPDIRNVTVVGAKGFTFGSIRTFKDQQNEVLIQGIPWYMEYPGVYKHNPAKAEQETSQREGRTIKYRDKKTEVKQFQKESKKITKEMSDVVAKLTSTEVNNALNEIQNGPDRDWWLTLIYLQHQLYVNARKNPTNANVSGPSRGSNLEFDMWYPSLTEAYSVTDGRSTTSVRVATILSQAVLPPGPQLTSIR